MRKSFILSLIAIAALAGCNSSTSTSSSTQTPHTMTATVNGKSWASSFNGVYSNAYATRYAINGATITAMAADSSKITIGIVDLDVVTDSLYTVDYAFYSSGPNDTSYITIPAINQAYSGWVTITDY